MPLVGEPVLNPLTGRLVRQYLLKCNAPSAVLKGVEMKPKGTIRQVAEKTPSYSQSRFAARAIALRTQTQKKLKQLECSGKEETQKSSLTQQQFNW